MYETTRFVLRLSPRNHELLESIGSGVRTLEDVTGEQIQAYSTYLHETVHWWQHVGSTSGLILSLSYLAQTHSSLTELRATLDQFGPKKSLRRYADEALMAEGDEAQRRLAQANIAINNALDVEFYQAFALQPDSAASWLTEQIHFEAVGHGYFITYGMVAGLVAAAIDPDFTVICGGERLDARYRAARRARLRGFYHGSVFSLPPIGLRALYEGQARFIQLQFLNSVRAEAPPLHYWREQGFLAGMYVEAFERFLEFTGSNWPLTISDPLVGLFLLVCDMAINPTRGFPYEIERLETFIEDIDSGLRFVRLCEAVAQHPHLKSAIVAYSREEYIAVSTALAEATGMDPPVAALKEIVGWLEELPELRALMEEHRTFRFDRMHQPVRVFVSHFVDFVRDKLARPEFFCWPGHWMVGDGAEQTVGLWLRHLSLFSDRGDKPGVYPREWPDRDPSDIKEMFERFYGTMALYDLTRQWILSDGPFRCDFEWLTENYSQERAEAWANDSLQQVFGVTMDDFEILSAATS